MNDDRPNPDDLLDLANAEARKQSSGRLRVFLGMSAGVGKTYAMLSSARKAAGEGRRVLIGVVETHGRVETAALLDGLELLPRAKFEHRGAVLEELDLDGLLAAKPDIAVVDELAHSNAPGARHKKRWQDVAELLDAGIDVYTALNVQHLESRKEAVEAITQIPVRETVPDGVLDRATLVELVDIAPSELLRRLSEGKVYLGAKAERAAQNFFREDKLTALREIALRTTAERVDRDLQRLGAASPDRGPWQANERLLVAVSHSPHSESLIRSARRIAANLESPWIAVHVDSGDALSDEDAAQLATNLRLARELGGDVVSAVGTDVPSSIRRLAVQRNVSQALVGRPGARRWLDRLVRGSLLDRLVRECPELDVHVVRRARAPGAADRPNKEKLFVSGFQPYWQAFWFVFAVAFASGLAEPWIGYRATGFVFLIGVLAAGSALPLGPVVFAAGLSAVAWDFFFIPPRLQFVIQSADDAILCAAFFVVALVTGLLTERARRNERLMRERESRNETLYAVARDLAESRSIEELLKRATDRAGALLGGSCAAILTGNDGKLDFEAKRSYSPRLDAKERAVAAWTFSAGRDAGWSTETLSESKTLFIPLKGAFEKTGVFAFSPLPGRRRFAADEEEALHAIARQIATSLERRLAESRLQDAKRAEDSARLQDALLNLVSHEIRTPLSAIVGAASALREGGAANDPVLVRELARQMESAGARLDKVVENLLDMSRLESGQLQLKLEWNDLADVAGYCARKQEARGTGRPIDVTIADGMPLARLDYRLFAHALSNLIENADLYSKPGGAIHIVAEYDAKSLRLHVDDDGPGIAPGDRARLFEKFARGKSAPAGGLGLGLSIAQAILQAHGGSACASSSPTGGARFTLEVPRLPQPASPEEAAT